MRSVLQFECACGTRTQPRTWFRLFKFDVPLQGSWLTLFHVYSKSGRDTRDHTLLPRSTLLQQAHPRNCYHPSIIIFQVDKFAGSCRQHRVRPQAGTVYIQRLLSAVYSGIGSGLLDAASSCVNVRMMFDGGTLGHFRMSRMTCFPNSTGLPGTAGRLSRTSIPLCHLCEKHQDLHMSSKVRLGRPFDGAYPAIMTADPCYSNGCSFAV